jgi:hypothetical protein
MAQSSRSHQATRGDRQLVRARAATVACGRANVCTVCLSAAEPTCIGDHGDVANVARKVFISVIFEAHSLPTLMPYSGCPQGCAGAAVGKEF